MQQDIEVKAVIERIKNQLAQFYDGASWVTENFTTKVLSIKDDEAQKKVPEHSHSIAELTGHITAWRNFAVQKLTGNDTYDITEESADWPAESNWDVIRKEFETCHLALLDAIENFSTERWNEKVPGRNYSFVYLIEGIIQHDYYHYGQIGAVIAGIKRMQKKD